MGSLDTGERTKREKKTKMLLAGFEPGMLARNGFCYSMEGMKAELIEVVLGAPRMGYSSGTSSRTRRRLCLYGGPRTHSAKWKGKWGSHRSGRRRKKAKEVL